MKTAILSWLQNDGTGGFSVNQLKGKQLSLTFQPEALVDQMQFSPADN